MLWVGWRVPILWLLACLGLASCWYEAPPRSDPPRAERRADDVYLPFGNPSNASRDPFNKNNYLLIKRSFIVSYNDSRGSANWIGWRTTINELGDSLPRPNFEPDPQLPPGFTRVTPAFYSGSGYDRGHLVPSADRFGNEDLNAETFQMTNIVPQARVLNQYPWEKLERYARGVVRRGSDIYTFAGVYGEKGKLRNRVTVPTNCWKIIFILPLGTGPEALDESATVIAVDMPNDESVATDNWQKYLTSVGAIEQKTGYNFLSALPADIQASLRNKIYRSER